MHIQRHAIVGTVAADFHAQCRDFGQSGEIWGRVLLAWRGCNRADRVVERGIWAHIHPRRTRHTVARDTKMRQRFQNGRFQAKDMFFDEITSAFEIDQGVSHHLAGPVVGDLPPSVAGNHRNVGVLQQMLGLAGQALGKHGRVLAQPNFIRRSQVTVRGERLHRRQTWCVVDPPFVDQLWLVVNRH